MLTWAQLRQGAYSLGLNGMAKPPQNRVQVLTVCAENVHPFTPRIFAACRLLPAEVAPAEVTTPASLVQLWTTDLAPYLSACNNPVSVQLCRINSELLGCWDFFSSRGRPRPQLSVCLTFLHSQHNPSGPSPWSHTKDTAGVSGWF